MIICCLYKGKLNIYIPRSLMIYVLVLLIVFTYHLSTNSSEAIKSIFSLIVEQLGVYILLNNLIECKAQWYKGMKIMVDVSCVMSVFAIFESLIGINIFHYLTTTSREMLQVSYERLGTLRAEGPFGHPVYFAFYLVSMLPFIFYFYENTGKKSYLISIILNIIAVILTGTRGGLVALIILLACMFLFKNKKIKAKYLKVLISLIPVAGVAYIIFPDIFFYAGDLINSTLYALGWSSSEVATFGSNSLGLSSRTMQLSGLLWAKINNALLMGFGPAAHMYGKISYINYISGNWNAVRTIDVGYIGYVLLYGIIGSIGYAILYVTTLIRVVKKSDEKDENNIYNPYKYFLIAYFVLLLSSVGQEDLFFVLLSMLLVYENMNKKEQNELKGMEIL